MSSLIGPVPDGWQEMPLADVCHVLAGPSNSMIRPVETDGVPIEVVAPKHLLHGRIADSSTLLVTAEASARLDRYRLVPGDLICVRTGDLGKQALAGPEHQRWVVGTACFRLRPEPTVESRYLLQYLRHPTVRDWIARHASTATVPSLTLSTLRTLPVLVPPSAVQTTIGDIMSALDDKIALHREIVEVTEQLSDSLLPLLLANR
ncbi:restriction endonuclease subunit S [Micromonospora sp. STR1_7]|uniref:Restriction endonuclease subunit S n=1 Tax=Micromonospora parastrephiae TaxID=2806101 RepID=A0ABS1XQD7_9ACTN|nr:restriction endonuclease subunit S [Micromonospora parastrephiae]MBM0231457.1 restriction endonuclease subunit S [Micromonospora parastrephiae]